MPRNGSGGYSPPAGQPVVSGTAISSTVFNALVADLGNELTKSICTDGQTPMTANLPMGANRVTNLGAAITGSDAARLDQVTSAVSTALSAYLPLAGGAMSGAIAMGANKVTNLGSAVSGSDAARLDQITASQAGALPLAGGQMTGNINFSNNTGLFFKDSANALRQVFVYSADNNIYTNLGQGGYWRLLNSTSTTTVFQIDNSGNIAPLGGVTLNNNVPLYMKDSSGNVRTVTFIDPANWLNYFGAPSGTRWWNAASSAVRMTLSDGGDLSAVTVTQTSDERKKKSWQRLPHNFIEELASIRKSGLFTWRKGGNQGLGVGAQSLERILPAAVHTDDEGNKSVNYGAAALVSCVELAREIKLLKAELAKLVSK